MSGASRSGEAVAATPGRSNRAADRGPRWAGVPAPAVLVAALAGCSGLGSTGGQAGVTPASASVTAPPTASTAAATGSASPSASRSASPSASRSASPSASATTSAPRLRALRPGSSGAQVTALQQRLSDLGYWVSTVNGRYGLTTSQAVMALQKVAGLSRDGVAGPKTMAALQAGIRPSARTSTGSAIEIDKARQVVKVVRDGRVRWVLNTSTGSGETYRNKEGQLRIAVTPSGSYRVGRQIRGWHTAPLGRLYSPKFFNGGIALHGSDSIPGYPASHGCARLSVPAMDLIWTSGAMPIGARVLVY